MNRLQNCLPKPIDPGVGRFIQLGQNFGIFKKGVSLPNLTFPHWLLLKIFPSFMTENKINDIESLIDNSGLGMDDIVYIKENPLNDISRDVYIPQLEERGIEIR